MKKIFLVLVTISLLGGTGCKKGFLDVNTNPNQSTSADPSLVFPAALNVTVGNWYPGPTAVSEWMGSWAVSGSYAINANDPGTTYKMTTSFGDGTWISVYDNLEDYQYIQDASIKNNKPFFEGVARIMKVVNYQHLVDAFNDIPYTDALKGVNALRPAYTKGMVVYDSLFNELQKAITLLNNAAVTATATSDIMFGGDKTKWIKFANTERLKMLLRMSQLSTKPDFFQPNLALTVAEPAGFLTTDALVQPGYVNSKGQANPFWQRFYNLSGQPVSSFGDFWAANEFAVNFYKNNNDPRLTREFLPIKVSTPYADAVVGNKLGLANGNPVNGKYSVFGPGILKGYTVIKSILFPSKDSLFTTDPSSGSTAPAVMMLASESYFLQAEAAALGYISGSGATLYKNGIAESFHYLGVPGSPTSPTYVDTFNTWYASQAGNTKVDYTTATTVLAKQTLILRQKWAALVSINSTVSYADYRKFDYLHTGTAPYPGPLGDTPLSFSPYIDLAKIPLRLKYPESEYSKNPENVNAQGTIDQQVNKIWWMQ